MSQGPADVTPDRRDDEDHEVTVAGGTSAGAPEPEWADGDFTPLEERPAADLAAYLAAGLARLPDIGGAVRRGARVWCAVGVVGLLLGLAYHVVRPAAYQASTSVLLAHSPNDNPADAVLTDEALAQSRSVAGRAMTRLGLHESVRSFLAAYVVTATTDRVLLITVKAPSSRQAVLWAGVVATQFLQFRAQELQTQQRHEIATLDQQITQAKQQVQALGTQIAQVSAQAPSPAQQAQLDSLRTQRSQANSSLTGLEQAATSFQVTSQTTIASIVDGSKVLDAAAPSGHSPLRQTVLYAAAGLIAGLVVGLFVVMIQALVSDRLRRRDDVADALGAPVGLSVGRIRTRRWLPGRSRLEAAQGREVQRIVGHLRDAVPGGYRSAALAIVPVDNVPVAALALASLAVSCAREGQRIMVADLAAGSPAARLLGARKPGLTTVSKNGVQLVVAIPDRDDVAPVGPLHRISPQVGPGAGQAADSRALAAADLLLTLAPLDPAIGAGHLASWAASAVAVVTAGRSSATRIRAVGEMIRLAGTPLVSAVLIGADKTDETLGVMRPPEAEPHRIRPD
jgi:capsular polysaccharide biosynthesis protein